MRHRLSTLAVACALGSVPAAAQADPVTIVANIVYTVSGSAVAASVAAGFIEAYGGYLLLGASIYGGMDARRRAKNAQRDAIRRYNASVTDRLAFLLQATPTWRIVYGECITGGTVVANFTSDKPVYSRMGVTGTKPDGLKHVVYLMASHEVEALGDLAIEGVPLGALDGSGYATGSDWTTGATEQINTVTFTGSTTVDAPAASIVEAVSQASPDDTAWTLSRTVAISGGGNTLTVTDGLGATPVTVAYKTTLNPAVIRVQKHLGTDSQTVDAYLNAIKPAEWDSTHRLRGCAYLVVTLDLEDQRFQGGPPNITCRVKGKKLYDPRKDSTNGGSGSHRTNDSTTWEWSDNPALCVRDWITGEYGMAHDHADIIDSFTIAAANACEVSITTDIGGSTATDVTYRCNGVATTDDGREQVLDKLADSMAGFAVYGAQWQILAGAWTAPVMDLTDDDLDGQIEIVQAGAGIDELVNGVRGTYIGVDSASPTDFQPYQNSTFVAADGEALWQDVALPFTSSKPHCANIARILVERGRNSQVIQYPAKLRAWPLQVGDRVTVTSAEYSISTPKTYRVTDWQFGLRAPVVLTLQEDAADAYDTVDAVDAAPTPNTDLPSPWLVETLVLGTPESGTNHLLRSDDGTIIVRVWANWSALTGAYMQDGAARVVLRWRRIGPDAEWRYEEVDPATLGLYLVGVQDGDRVAIEAWAVNAGGWRGASDSAVCIVAGKSVAPADVSGLAATAQPGGVAITVTPSTEADVVAGGALELRVGASWGAGTRIFRGPADRFVWPWPAAGSYTIRARWIDSSGNYSAADATASITVGNASLINSAQIVDAAVGRPQIADNSATLLQESFTAGPLSVTSSTNVKTLAATNADSAARYLRATGSFTFTATAGGGGVTATLVITDGSSPVWIGDISLAAGASVTRTINFASTFLLGAGATGSYSIAQNISAGGFASNNYSAVTLATDLRFK